MKKNTFIRIDSDLHHKIKIKVTELGLTMMRVTEELLKQWLRQIELRKK